VSLAAVLGALWFLQRRLTRGAAGRRRRDNGITVLSRQGLGGKAQLVVVEVEGTRYVLGVTEQGVTVVDRTRAPQQIGPARAETSDVVGEFERLLAESARTDSARTASTPADSAWTDSARPGETDAATAPLRRDRRERDAPRRPSDGARPADPLHGSILSPGTWRQTAQALRRVR
jgi:flagellar protein FliO/FliZ